MIRRGWDHPALSDMHEDEFIWWLDQQMNYDREVEAARKDAEKQRE
jgi:hypothetical protein